MPLRKQEEGCRGRRASGHSLRDLSALVDGEVSSLKPPFVQHVCVYIYIHEKTPTSYPLFP